jgi:hypothetical protein
MIQIFATSARVNSPKYLQRRVRYGQGCQRIKDYKPWVKLSFPDTGWLASVFKPDDFWWKRSSSNKISKTDTVAPKVTYLINSQYP